jgi:hypothetical protein
MQWRALPGTDRTDGMGVGAHRRGSGVSRGRRDRRRTRVSGSHDRSRTRVLHTGPPRPRPRLQLDDVGFCVPAQGGVYRNGEAVSGTDYKDLDEIPDPVATMSTMTAHAAHLARLLTANGYPAT